MTGGFTITEMTRIRPAQREQARTSILKTRRKRVAQSMRELPSLLLGRQVPAFTGAGSCPGARAPVRFGTT